MDDHSDHTPLQVSRRTVMASAAAVSAAAAIVGQVAAAPRASAAPGDGSLRVSSLGHDPVDSTSFLQQAFDSDATTVIIDRVPGGWITGPLFLRRSDVTVIIEPEVMVKAKPGAFTGANDCLLTVANVSNIVISGYGATLAMQKGEYTSGEWRMALSLLSVRNVEVEGLTLRDTGGDGVYLGRGTTAYSSNVTLRDVTCDNARRNGLSVISVDGLHVEGCRFANTNGTAPQAGVDFEPNHADNKLTGITFTDCVFEQNVAQGVAAVMSKLDGTSSPVDITISRSTISGHTGEKRQIGAGFFLTSARNGLQGRIEIADSLFRMGPASAVIAAFNSDATGVQLQFTRDTIWDWGNAKQTYEPIIASSGLQQRYGGMTFTDCVLVSDQGAPQVRAHREAAYDPDGTAAFAGMHGTLLVIDPYGVGVDPGDNPPVDVDLTTPTEPAGRRDKVRVTAGGGVAGGQDGELVFARLGRDVSTSLAVAYEVSGSARERYDYGGLGRVAVIPPGERQVSIPVRTFARRQASDPQARELVVTVAAGHRYEAIPQTATILITG